MDVTGLRVSIDASAARQGEQIFNQSLDSMAGKARTVSAQLRDGFRPGEEGLRSLGATGRTVSQQLGDSFEKMRTGMRGLVDSVLNFRTLFDTAIAGISFRAVIDQIAKIQDIKYALQAVTGSAVAAGATWRMLQGDAEKYGYQAEDLAQKFARLSMATKGTALEGQRTVTIFRASEMAARALGTGAEGAERTVQSFTNILSSANVQGDMMVRQLARFGGIPGAMSIAARAFGVSVNQMQEKLKSGTLSSEEFVAKFTQQMVKELGPAAEKAAQGISAWQERVSGAFKELVGEIGGGGLADTIVGFLKTLRDELESPGFKEAARQLGGLLANALNAVGKAIEFAGEHVGLLKAAFVGLIAYEAISFFESLTKNVLALAEGFKLAATAALGLKVAEGASLAAAAFAGGGIMGKEGPVPFAQGGVMTSQGPAPVPGSQAKVPEGRIDTVRSSIIAEGYVSKPNVAFESGGILTSDGPSLLKRYAEGGVADSPHVALFGEGSKPEAFVPLQDGSSIPVSISASSAFVPLPDGRKIPAALNIKRFAAGGTTDDDTSLVSQVAKQQDSIDALELAANIVPATQTTPEYKPTRTFGPAQGAMPMSSASVTGQAMAQEAAPLPTSSAYRHETQQTIVNNNNQINLPTTTPTTAAPAQAHRADASVSGGSGLMKALESVAPALMAAVVFLRRSAPATIAPTSTLTTMRAALRSEPQDNALHQVGRTMIETRAVSGVEECAKKAASGLDSIANAAKPAERSLLSLSDVARALPRVPLPASGTPPISSGIAKLMSEGRGGIAYPARTAQLAAATRPLAGVGEQMGLFAGQEALGDLGAINIKAESSVTRQVPAAIGLFEAMYKRAGAVASGIGDAFVTAGRTVSSGLRVGLEAVTGLLESTPRKFQAMEDALVGFFGTTLPSKIGAAKTAVTDFISLGASGMWKKFDAGLGNLAGQGAMQRVAGIGETALADTGESALASAAVGTVGAVGTAELTGGLTGATGAAGGLGSALAAFANPIGIAVAAVALLAGGLYAVRNNQVTINGEAFKMGDIYAGIWMKIKQWAEAFWNWLSATASKVFKAIGSLGEQAIDGVFGKGTTSKIEGWLGSAWEGFKGFFYNVAKEGKAAREEVEALAKAADIREKIYGSEKFLAPGRAELAGSLQPSVVDQIMRLEAQYPPGFAGKTPKEAATVQVPLGPGMGGGALALPSTPDELKLAASIRDQINNLMMGIGTGAPEKPFRQPEPPWTQTINELQAKAALAAPTATAALFGQDEVERLKEATDAERMIVELHKQLAPKEVTDRVRAYFAVIAEGTNTLKLNTEIEKERAKILATPAMGRTPTYEYVDRTTFGGVNPERQLGLAVFAADATMNAGKMSTEQYASALRAANQEFQLFMSEHTRAVELKPLGFQDVTEAIHHGTFAYEEYLHLEQQQVANWERLKGMSAETIQQWNKEAEANYLRTAAMKEYAALASETEKARFEIPRMQQLQTAQLQGAPAARAVQAQQAQEAQLFQTTGARSWDEFKQRYGAALATPEMLPTNVSSYAQGLGLIGAGPKPQQPKLLGVDIGTEQNPLVVMVSKAKAAITKAAPGAPAAEPFDFSDILGPEVSGLLGLTRMAPQAPSPLRPQGVQVAPTAAPPNVAQNMSNIDAAAAKDLAARMDLARQQSIDKTIQEIAALDPGQALKEYEEKLKDINAAVAQQPQLWAASQQAIENAGRAYREQIDKMMEDTHNFVDGAAAAFDQYAIKATDAAGHAREVVTSFMDGLTKNLTEAMTTGKSHFQKMFQELRDQVVGGLVQQVITGPMAQGVGAVLEGRFGTVIPGLGGKKETPQDAMAKRLQEMGTENKPLWVKIQQSAGGSTAGRSAGAVGSGGAGGVGAGAGDTFTSDTVSGSMKGGGGLGQTIGTVGAAGEEIAGAASKGGARGAANAIFGRGQTPPLARLIMWALGPHGGVGRVGGVRDPGLDTPHYMPGHVSATTLIPPKVTIPMGPMPNLPPITPAMPTLAQAAGAGAGFNPVTDEISDMLAGGGPVRAGRTYLVGEKGRELFVPNEDGQIIPNKMLGFARGGTMGPEGGMLGGAGSVRTGALIDVVGEGLAGGSSRGQNWTLAPTVRAFAQGGTIGPGGVGSGGTTISASGGGALGSGTSISPSGIDLTVAGSGMGPGGGTVTYLNDEITKKVRYAIFNWQQTSAGGWSTPAGMFKETGPPAHRNWWLTDFLPTVMMFFSNFMSAYSGIKGGGSDQDTGQMFSNAFKGVFGIQTQPAGGSGPGPQQSGGGGPEAPTAPMPPPPPLTPDTPPPTSSTPGWFPPMAPPPTSQVAPEMPDWTVPDWMTPQSPVTPSPTMPPPPTTPGQAPHVALPADRVLEVGRFFDSPFFKRLFGDLSQAGEPGHSLMATGGVMTPFGPMPLRPFDDGGIATMPQVALFGEGSMHEAFVPLPDGRTIPVTMQQRQGSGGVQSRTGDTYRTEVHVHGVQNVDQFRRSRSQLVAEMSNAQAMQRKVNR